MLSKGGGRKRGRPVILTPEQKLKRERERWRRKKARKRKAAHDAAWQRDTNSGYFVQLWVPHYNHLTEALVGAGPLSEADANIAPRVDAAVDAVFQWLPDEYYPGRWWSGKTLSRRGPDKQGVVRIRMTADLIDRLVAYGCLDQYEASHPRPQPDGLIEECRLAEARFRECEAAFKLLIPGPERIRARVNVQRAEAARRRLEEQIDHSPPIDEGELAKFAEGLRHHRPFLRKMAEEVLCQWYAAYVPEPPWRPCNCKLALPKCECLTQFKVEPVVGILEGPPKPKRPKAGKVLAKRDLYSGPKPRWWRNPRYDDDPIIRSHDKSASVGMEGFGAGGPGVWKIDNAEYFPEQDNRASTRDWNRSAREGEKALQKPYDDPTGIPKSWSNPSDVAPASEDTISRLGKRVIEDGKIERSKDDN
jgi:hypothetical protein